ncbi:MAG: HAMP domain-containing histidine kinase [Phycisphaerae bacterium]|nr:HAMP domain-containing histidine kinase [Phycisphaerae bacterium]
MNKRFWIICSVIGSGLLTLSVLGLSSLGMHEKGLRAERQQEFMDVAKQISFDVKKKVDTFLQTEQGRLYTDYQPYYVPEVGNNTAALVPSPLANLYSNGLANGYFQLEADGQLISPHFAEQPMQQAMQAKQPVNHSDYFDNVKQNLLPSLASGQTVATHRVEPTEREKMEDKYTLDKIAMGRDRRTRTLKTDSVNAVVAKSESSYQFAEDRESKEPAQKKQVSSKSKGTKAAPRQNVYQISNLKERQQTTTQVLRQRRDNYEVNVASNTAGASEKPVSEAVEIYNRSRAAPSSPLQQEQQSSFGRSSQSEQKDARQSEDMSQQMDPEMDLMMMVPATIGVDNDASKKNEQQLEQADTVQVRIEPFVPMTVSVSNGNNNGLFAGQVFLLRHVQIEDRHLVQGFQLNEDELLSQVAESARRYLRRGMGYEISKLERPDAAFAAILQFDFGEVVLNLLEQDAGYIQAQVLRMRNWFYGILGVVWLSVFVAMLALWKNLNQQVQLSRKKDDFISAVSHELRTPLTSIRMYTEMLEKDWVKTDGKRREYYTTMRTESERLTRLIENVLDFSRIQRGKKRYDFTVGDVNECIGEVADMMRPYAQRAGFVLEQRFEVLEPFAFDRDAVVQIVINLVDNALKYAKDARDKHIIIRTRAQKGYAIIEIEDHGPGIPRSQQKKIFDAFYRCEDESTRQNTGTGLGLALVKRFAEAHHGFVEIVNAKPTGALFRIGLTMQ